MAEDIEDKPISDLTEQEKLQIVDRYARDKKIPPEDVVKKIKELYGPKNFFDIRRICEYINKKIINGDLT